MVDNNRITAYSSFYYQQRNYTDKVNYLFSKEKADIIMIDLLATAFRNKAIHPKEIYLFKLPYCIYYTKNETEN